MALGPSKVKNGSSALIGNRRLETVRDVQKNGEYMSIFKLLPHLNPFRHLKFVIVLAQEEAMLGNLSIKLDGCAGNTCLCLEFHIEVSKPNK